MQQHDTREELTEQQAEAEGWLQPFEVAQMLKVTPRTVGRYAREGKLPYRRTIGGHRRYRLADVLAADGSAQRYSSGQQGGSDA